MSNHLPFRAWVVVCVVAYGLTPGALAAPMTYRATLVTDVRVGTTTYTNAAVKVTFKGCRTKSEAVPTIRYRPTFLIRSTTGGIWRTTVRCRSRC